MRRLGILFGALVLGACAKAEAPLPEPEHTLRISDLKARWDEPLDMPGMPGASVLTMLRLDATITNLDAQGYADVQLLCLMGPKGREEYLAIPIGRVGGSGEGARTLTNIEAGLARGAKTRVLCGVEPVEGAPPLKDRLTQGPIPGSIEAEL